MSTKTKKFDNFAKRFVADTGISDARNDAVATSVYFSRQLEDIDAQIQDVKYADLKSLKMVQLLPGLDPLAARYTRRIRDWNGAKAKRSTHPTDTAPLAQTSRREESLEYFVYKEGFAYSREELAIGARFGVNLDRERSDAARSLLAQSLDALIATGDSEVGMQGLLNVSGAQTYALPTDGTGATATFSTKTPDQVLRDLNAIVTQMLTTTKSIFNVQRMILPTTIRRYLESTYRATNSDLTIMNAFKLANPGIEILDWERLSDSTKDLYGNSCNGTSIGSGLTRIVAGNFDVNLVRALVPIAVEMLEPERQGEGFKVDMKMKVGGVDAPQPKALIYIDGA